MPRQKKERSSLDSVTVNTPDLSSVEKSIDTNLSSTQKLYNIKEFYS